MGATRQQEVRVQHVDKDNKNQPLGDWHERDLHTHFRFDDRLTVQDWGGVERDLLKQKADAIVNAWNRNVVPWWLLLPQGVSGAIKRRAGLEPFRELARIGPMPLGTAVDTGAGRLPYAGIIHVAGINLLWRASARSICDSVRNAMVLANERGFERGRRESHTSVRSERRLERRRFGRRRIGRRRRLAFA